MALLPGFDRAILHCTQEASRSRSRHIPCSVQLCTFDISSKTKKRKMKIPRRIRVSGARCTLYTTSHRECSVHIVFAIFSAAPAST